MKQTIFKEFHEQCGARMVDFAGFYMPVEYFGINDEHLTVRSGVGVFDVSHMGEIWFKGPKALDLLQRISSNDASALFPGRVQYSCMPNGRGGVVDDVLVYKFDDQLYLMVVNASNIEKDWNWIQSQNTFGAEIDNASDRTSQLAIQGPKAMQVMQKLTSVDLGQIPYYHFTVGDFAGVENVIISNTGYTGSGGFEIYFDNEDGIDILNKLLEAGKDENIKMIGLAARDTLRLEKGFCLYGHELSDETSPIEAGLGWVTKLLDDKDLIDKDLLALQKKNGVSQKLIGFEMVDRGIPRNGYVLEDIDGNQVGVVTSGTMSPSLKIGIGMAYVKTEFSTVGTELYIPIRNKKLRIKIVKLPFVK